VVDLFAGGGGASTGIAAALGHDPDLAVNHDPEALLIHRANHPSCHHLGGDVWNVDPKKATAGRGVELLWLSPDCKHFSRAKGKAPVSSRVRSLAWVAVRWAREVRPSVIMLENVPEFRTWGPLLEDGAPDPERKGTIFARWVAKLRSHGYVVDWRELVACDYGTPTSRKRLFLIGRRDGQPIVWPEPTHGPGRPHPYRTARSIIDWSIPVPSIFARRRPLAEPTMRRIARGLVKFGGPHVSAYYGTSTGSSLDEPLGTVTALGIHHALVQTGYGEREGQAPRCLDLDEPLGTIPAGGCKHALVAFVAKACRAWLDRYVGPGAFPHLTDIGLRMLEPRELFRAQGFPDSYVIAPLFAGKSLSKRAQIRLCGNSVPPQLAEALVRANLGARDAAAA
jgi:DNA (cytosine-5)-methyltransferase 1